MSDEKRPKRGGSDSAREAGLTGVVIHLTPEERRLVGMAAASEGESVKGFCAAAVVGAAQKILKEQQS